MGEKGKRWYYAICEIFYNEWGRNSVYYRGFHNILSKEDSRIHLVGVFETVDKDLDLAEFSKKYEGYSNKDKGILSVSVYKEFCGFRNCIVVWLR